MSEKITRQPFIYDYQKQLGATERKASMTVHRYRDDDLEIGMTKLIRNKDDVLECQVINLVLPPDQARKLRDYLINVYPTEEATNDT